MRETAAIANIGAVERVEKITPLAAQKKSKTVDVSHKTSFAELVERARKEVAQTEKSRNDEKVRFEKSDDGTLKRIAQKSDEKIVTGDDMDDEVLQSDARQAELVQDETEIAAFAQPAQSAFFADADDATVVELGKSKSGATEIDDSAEIVQVAFLLNVADTTQIANADIRQNMKNAEELTGADDAPLSSQEVFTVEDSAILLATQTLQKTDTALANETKNNNFTEDSKAEINGEKARNFALDKDGKIIVSDFRTALDNEQTMAEVKSKTASERLTISSSEGGVNQAELTMSVAQNVQQNVLSENAQTAGAVSSNFQAMLANQIQQNAGEFVRAGSIVLRDGNQGTINLVLHPESLGNVKISLSLSDKVVSGQIIVASEEAYSAFNDSADSLRQAFSQSGFEAGAFTVAYSGAQNSGASGNGNESGYVFANGGSNYEAAIGEETAIPGGGYMQTEHVVNMIA